MSTLLNELKGKRASFVFFNPNPVLDFVVLPALGYSYAPAVRVMATLAFAGSHRLRMILTTPMRVGSHYQRRKYPLGMAYTLRKASIR